MLAWSALYASLAKARAASTYRQTAYRIDNAIDLMFSIALCDGDGGERGGGGMRPWPRRELQLPTADSTEARHCQRVDMCNICLCVGAEEGKGGGVYVVQQS